MKFKSNYTTVVISLAIIILFVVACQQQTQIGSKTGAAVAPPTILPKGVKNAETVALNDTAVILSVPSQGEFYVGTKSFPQDEISEKLARVFEGQPAVNRSVYVAGSQLLDYGEVLPVFTEARKEGIGTFALLVEPAADGGGGRRILRVQIIPEPDENQDLSDYKPDPLTLVVSIAKDLKLKLNQEPMGDATSPSTLEQKLTRIFQQRKELRDYKPGLEKRSDLPEDERVEKTIVVKAQRSTRYGDVVRLIDAIKGAGANPIVLQIDDLSD
jgi:biopolymer transport protein ExbD